MVIPPIIKVTTNKIVTENLVEDGSDWVDYDTDNDELINMVDDSLPGLNFDGVNFGVDPMNNSEIHSTLDGLGLYDSGIEASGKGELELGLDYRAFYKNGVF